MMFLTTHIFQLDTLKGHSKEIYEDKVKKLCLWCVMEWMVKRLGTKKKFKKMKKVS